ncbi:unnamed protein product, partial [Meganyctiphanes norvegica]
YQLDVLYLGWVFSLVYPVILTIFILPGLILLMLYLSALILHIYRHRSKVFDALHQSLDQRDPWVGGRNLIGLLWDAHGIIWHGYEVTGLENLPESGPALIIYYHGALPLDIYYLVSRVILLKKRLIVCVADRFLEKIPGWKVILEAFKITPGTVSICSDMLRQGHILSISPGGVREALFSDNNYDILWGKRCGFAKVALQANVPIIPMFTENLREAFRTFIWPQWFWLRIYEFTRLPLVPLYGGFPVKLRTHLGRPIIPMADETPDELAARVKKHLYELIHQHQRLPGNIFRSLVARVYEKPKEQ